MLVDSPEATDDSRSYAMVAALRPALLPQWALLSWYIVIISFHAASAPAHTWWNALVVACIVGSILNFNSYSAVVDTPFLTWIRGCPFAVTRFYAIPFCVSSYSGVVASSGDSAFVSIFPRNPDTLLWAVSSCAGVALLTATAWLLLSGKGCRQSRADWEDLATAAE